MSYRHAYYRVSSSDQSKEMQRHELGGPFDKEHEDEGVSGIVPALERPGFAKMFNDFRPADELHVYHVDRLGRDSIDIQMTVRAIRAKGVSIHVLGLGRIEGDVGDLILAIMAQLAQMDRSRIMARCASGRDTAKTLLAKTGRTQHGKTSLGRPFAKDAAHVRAWRIANKASIADTAAQFTLSKATVKRYCAEPKKAKVDMAAGT